MKRVMWTVAGVGLVAAVGAGVYFGFVRPGVATAPVVPPPDLGVRVAGPVPAMPFTDVTAAAGITFVHRSGAAGQKLLPETMGGGVAVIDYDADGRPDLLFVSGCPWPGSAAPAAAKAAPCLTLYRNRGDGTFADVTAAAGLAVTFYGMGACVGDYDNDGFPDLFVTGVGAHKLFHNVPAGGSRGFVEVTAAAGVTAPGALPASASKADFSAHAPAGRVRVECHVRGHRRGRPARPVSSATTCRGRRKSTWGIDATLVGIGRAYQQPQSLEGSKWRVIPQ